jgi:SPFH domain / Band 7 family
MLSSQSPNNSQSQHLISISTMNPSNASILPPPPPAPSARTVALARKVAAAKAESISFGEMICVSLGCLSTLPFLGLNGLRIVPPNTRLAVFRFGKLVTTVKSPGLTWFVPCGTFIEQFSGAQTYKMDSLHVVDAAGNPIVVRALLEYSIEDPAALHIAANGSLPVLFNMAEQVVREACTHLPLVGERGHDIRSQTNELASAMAVDLQPDASVLGITVLRLCIVEARYSSEIAPAMLAKQSAAAMVAARKEIVAGALNIVRDVCNEFPALNDSSRDRLVNNLLVSLTSHSPATPVLPLSN